MQIETVNNKNVMALVVNDEYCATILDNGEVRIVKKGNKDSSMDFKTILSLENEYIDEKDRLFDIGDEISGTKLNSIVTSIQGLVSIYLLVLSVFVFGGVPSIITLIGKIFLGGVSITSIGLAITNIKKNKQLREKRLVLRKKLRDLSFKLGEVMLTKNNVFIPTFDNRQNINKCRQNIIQSAELICNLLYNYVTERNGEEITKYEEIYLDNDILPDEFIKIKLPMHESDIAKAHDIVQDGMARKNIMDIRSECFEVESKHVLTKRIPF